jgi:cytochrome c1
VRLSLLGLSLVTLLACERPEVPAHLRVFNGDPEAGRLAIARYGCGACHVIPGLREADGTVGPPLTAFGLRAYVAGQVPNRPDNLTRWLRDPPTIEAGTAMPNLGVSEQDARDIAAYLYTLR